MRTEYSYLLVCIEISELRLVAHLSSPWDLCSGSSWTFSNNHFLSWSIALASSDPQLSTIDSTRARWESTTAITVMSSCEYRSRESRMRECESGRSPCEPF